MSGALVVLRFGDGTLLSGFGRLAPVALVGRVSYAAYLWHWPLIVLLPYATGHPLTSTDRVEVLLGTLALAWLSTTLVEDPVRFRPQLLGDRPPRAIAAFATASLVLVVSLAGAADHQQTTRDRALERHAAEILSQIPRCLGAAALVAQPCDNAALDGTLIPDPSTALADDANLPQCWGVTEEGTAKVCSLGPATGYSKHLLAIGDSHNNALIGLYRGIAEINGWRIDVAGRGGCYLTALPQVQVTESDARTCLSWRRQVIALARTGHYDAIVVTHATKDRPVIPSPGETFDQATVRGLVAAWKQLPDVPVLAIVDNPSMSLDYKTCVVAHPSTADTACERPRWQALGYFDGQREAAVQVPKARVIDLSDLYCTPTTCSPVVGHVLVYRDPSHVSATYARTLIPYADARVRAALS